jgi:hypothetical protein
VHRPKNLGRLHSSRGWSDVTTEMSRPEVRGRAVGTVLDSSGEVPVAVNGDGCDCWRRFDVRADPMRKWVRRAEVDADPRPASHHRGGECMRDLER